MSNYYFSLSQIIIALYLIVNCGIYINKIKKIYKGTLERSKKNVDNIFANLFLITGIFMFCGWLGIWNRQNDDNIFNAKFVLWTILTIDVISISLKIFGSNISSELEEIFEEKEHEITVMIGLLALICMFLWIGIL